MLKPFVNKQKMLLWMEMHHNNDGANHCQYHTEMTEKYKMHSTTQIVDRDVGRIEGIFKKNIGLPVGGNMADYTAETVEVDFVKYQLQGKTYQESEDPLLIENSYSRTKINPEWLQELKEDFQRDNTGIKACCIYKLGDIRFEAPMISSYVENMIVSTGNSNSQIVSIFLEFHCIISIHDH